tara:strand:- start:273 stop:500 length:228 start_codon:yes stop_codon:yes gene_type:complete
MEIQLSADVSGVSERPVGTPGPDINETVCRQDTEGGGGEYHQRQRWKPDVRGESLFQGKEDLGSEGRGYVLNMYI